MWYITLVTVFNIINPPPHANPILAACEGIKARQFTLSGFNNSKISHLNHSQIKSLLNNILLELDLTSGKIRSVTSARDNGIIVETNNNAAAKWFLIAENMQKTGPLHQLLCQKLQGNSTKRTYCYEFSSISRYASPFHPSMHHTLLLFHLLLLLASIFHSVLLILFIFDSLTLFPLSLTHPCFSWLIPLSLTHSYLGPVLYLAFPRHIQWLKKLFQCLVNLTCKSNYEGNTKAIILKFGTIV